MRSIALPAIMTGDGTLAVIVAWVDRARLRGKGESFREYGVLRFDTRKSSPLTRCATVSYALAHASRTIYALF
ncbi:hypothetical protein BN2476_460119 [Paraburkholderia piptadeniae]|uniref:Uncharacterized protein n=1 Tax=Paraburkholderia piptadeniae TaxID=1701573 RepID=A0A1N7SE54_9BURK|nr:hypothetical protein BN2476_460119 [Paraburkholderia piptadeniae]